jgi:hypothetical protein
MRPADQLKLRAQAGLRWRFAERHTLSDRSRGAERLLIVSARHKPTPWP